MASNKYYLGDLITQRREKNPGGDLPIRGVSKEGLQPPKQIDADTSIYNLYYRNDFVYNPARMELGSIAFNDEYDWAICSSLYEVFYVHRTDLVIPEYLALFVKHPEFARYCNYIGNGSAREYCRFDNISGIPIYLPPISEQRKIVHDYHVITDRIALLRKVNKNLEEQIMAVYHQFFDADGVCRDGIVSELGAVVGGATPSTENPEYFCENGIIWLSPKDITGSGCKFVFRGETDITEAGFNSCSTKMLPKGSVLLTSRAPVGTVAIAMSEMCTNQGFKSIVPKTNYWTEYIYCLLKDKKQLLEANSSGTTFLEISGKTLKSLVVPIPDDKTAKKFSDYCKPFFEQQMLFEKESNLLSTISSARVSSISKGA